jgi:hypothetical protein
MTPDRAAVPRPSVGYYLCLAAAMVGLVAVAIAIEATRRAAAGGDGQSALSGAGVPALILAWVIGYYARLAFWPRVSPAGQAAVAASLRVFMVAEIASAIVGSWWVFSQPAAKGMTRGIMIVGDLLQIGSLLWIARFSKETGAQR